MAAILHFRPSRRRILQNSVSSVHFYSSNSDDNNDTKKAPSLKDILYSRAISKLNPVSLLSGGRKDEFVRMYNKTKFSLSELSERLNSLRETEENETNRSNRFKYSHLRESLMEIQVQALQAQLSSLQSQLAGGRKDDFVRMYSYDELGKKLKELRPPKVNNNNKTKFSLSEFSERLNSLRETEENEANTSNGFKYSHLRENLMEIQVQALQAQLSSLQSQIKV